MRAPDPVRAHGEARGFDPVGQEWHDPEEERRIAGLHERDAARRRTALHGVLAVLAVGSLRRLRCFAPAAAAPSRASVRPAEGYLYEPTVLDQCHRGDEGRTAKRSSGPS
ncbi:hypothetical protein SALBM135S_04141 [Streptomyces alboniger]